VCNTHTYDCYVSEIQESCCDEGGRNCPADHDVPIDCAVGCAIVFPEFFETCHDHVANAADMDEHEFADFETQCLDQEGLALVEYALEMQADGCIIDLTGGAAVDAVAAADATCVGADDGTGTACALSTDLSACAVVGGDCVYTAAVAGGRRLQSSYLTQYLGNTEDSCNWDELDDKAGEVDSICCGADGSLCAVSNGVFGSPRTCSPPCAVAMHDFMGQCGGTLRTILGSDGRSTDISDFEQQCLDEADPMFFLEAIMHADCSDAENKGR
jgi:hypothetical protein